MPIALLETKWYVPRSRRGLVLRPRLSERLDQGTASKLVLVSAPAGFGKTTLLTGWLTTRKPLKLLALATTNNARPYTSDAVRTKIFRRPVRSESLPPMTEAAAMTADWASVARNICCGTSAAGEQLHQERAAHRRGGQADTQDNRPPGR